MRKIEGKKPGVESDATLANPLLLIRDLERKRLSHQRRILHESLSAVALWVDASPVEFESWTLERWSPTNSLNCTLYAIRDDVHSILLQRPQSKGGLGLLKRGWDFRIKNYREVSGEKKLGLFGGMQQGFKGGMTTNFKYRREGDARVVLSHMRFFDAAPVLAARWESLCAIAPNMAWAAVDPQEREDRQANIMPFKSVDDISNKLREMDQPHLVLGKGL